MHDGNIAWHPDLCANPELGYMLPRNASSAGDKLPLAAIRLPRGLARVGRPWLKSVVGKVVGLHTDRDALPIHEMTGLSYASTTEDRSMPAGTTGTRRC